MDRSMCLTALHRFSTSWIISSLNSDRAGSLRVLSSRSSHEPGVSDCHRLKCPFRFSVSNGNKRSIAGICSRRAVSLFGLSGVWDRTEFGSGISAFKEMLDLSAGCSLSCCLWEDTRICPYGFTTPERFCSKDNTGPCVMVTRACPAVKMWL